MCIQQGPGTVAEATQLLSSTLRDRLGSYLPGEPCTGVESGESPSPIGGLWFWEGHRAALYGHQVYFHIDGTGVNWREDPLWMLESAWKRHIESLEKERPSATSRNAKELPTSSPSVAPMYPFLLTSKLDILLGVFSSIITHVVHQPLLEANEGPSALILCPTRGSCDECSRYLTALSGPFHLLVHNAYEELPPETLLLPPPGGKGEVPRGAKVADIVVATPPLWETLVASRTAFLQSGLEEKLAPPHDLRVLKKYRRETQEDDMKEAWLGVPSSTRSLEFSDREDMLAVLEAFTEHCVSVSTPTINLCHFRRVKPSNAPCLEYRIPAASASDGVITGLEVWRFFPFLRSERVQPQPRPYRLSFISQIAIVDIESQVSMGYAGTYRWLLQRRRDPATSAAYRLFQEAAKGDLLVEDTQWYAIGARGFDSPMQPGEGEEGEISKEYETLMSALRDWRELGSGKDAFKTVQVGLASTASPAAPLEPCDPEVLVEEGLIFCHAFTAAHLWADQTVFSAFKTSVLQAAGEYWNSFLDVEKRGALPFHARIALLHPTLSSAERLDDVALLLWPSSYQAAHDGSSAQGQTTFCASRWSKLLNTLEEKLNGALFDGHVVRTERVQLRRCRADGEEKVSDSTVSFENTAGHKWRTSGCGGALASPAHEAPTETNFQSRILKELLHPEKPAWPEGDSPVHLYLSCAPRPSQAPLVKRRWEAHQRILCIMRAAANLQVPPFSTPPWKNEPHSVLSAPFSYYPIPYAAVALPASLCFTGLTTPVAASSVVVVRHLCPNYCKEVYASMTSETVLRLTHQRCSTTPSGLPDYPKSPSLHWLIDECSKIGRIVSFYCFEDGNKSQVVSPLAYPEWWVHTAEARSTGCFCAAHQEYRYANDDSAASTLSGKAMQPFSTSLFIEFERTEVATEVVRWLQEVFEGECRRLPALYASVCNGSSSPQFPFPFPTAKLFRNTSYYQGILETETISTNSVLSDFDWSLLAEAR